MNISTPLAVVLAASAAILCAATLVRSTELAARVVAIPSGESLIIEHGSSRETIQLHGIECPDRVKTKARQYLRSVALGKSVVVVLLDRDTHGRAIADVFTLDGLMLNAELIRRGLAWTDGTSYAMFNDLEDEARAAHRGMWNHESRHPPAAKLPHNRSRGR
jgi:micrococcal nuclease